MKKIGPEAIMLIFPMIYMLFDLIGDHVLKDRVRGAPFPPYEQIGFEAMMLINPLHVI